MFSIVKLPYFGHCLQTYVTYGRNIMETLSNAVSAVDSFVWGPVMLVLLVGTGIYLTIRTGFLPWLNLGYALKSTLSKEARKDRKSVV